jgi:hypothetical protein
MNRVLKGQTPETVPPFLGAEFWKDGAKIAGEVAYCFDTEHGPACAVQLGKAVEVKGEKHSIVSLGNMKGLQAALRLALARESIKTLVPGDGVFVQAIGQVETGKESPMVRFEVEVTRE